MTSARTRPSVRTVARAALGLLLLTLVVLPSGFAQSQPNLVAAYSFNEGTGTSAADASGSGNAGAIGSATWSTQGKYGNAVSFNGTTAKVTINDAPSLRLTSAMTLEAWVNPSTVSGAWRDLLIKGNDDYYLMATSTNSSAPVGAGIFGGVKARAIGTSSLTTNAWTHLATTYDGANLKLYVNGVLVATTPKTGTIQTSASALQIGGDAIYGQYFSGLIDEVRVYNAALTQAQVQADMTTPIVTPGGDTTPPTVAITAPANNAQVTGGINITASASDNVGVAGVQFLVDGLATGAEDQSAPYAVSWDSQTVSNGAHTLTARARDAAGNSTLSAPIGITVSNAGSGGSFQNEVLATGFNLPTNIEFLPDGRMLVVEFTGAIKVVPPPYTQADPTPFLQVTNLAPPGPAADRGIFDLALDPQFSTNHYFYIFYVAATPTRDRLSRFTANAALTGTVPGSEVILYQDPQDTLDSDQSHHGGAIVFGNDGKLYFTTGDHFQGAVSQSLSNPRGKLLRINKDGTVPTDNPFYDGNGPNVDSIWALGLRNPFRAYYDSPTGRLYIGDVGGNDTATSYEELDLGVQGANYGWPDCELGTCGNPAFTAGLYAYPHAGRDASITAGFVYHGTQFPASYQGSFFFADYAQNWIKRLTFDASGDVTGVFNFEPPDGSADGPYGDIVDLKEGPDGALYYADIGYSDTTGQTAVSKIRRIRFVSGDQPPTAASSASPTAGPAPLTVNFSSAGSSDPEGQPLSYSWTFGDNTTSTAANPGHTYTQAGQYTARLTVSDGTNSTLAAPLTISVGSPPSATINSPTDGAFFVAGDVISYSGSGTDPDDGTLPASAFTWNIDFLHEGHVHPGTPVSGAKSGTFTIPTTGHDFSGNTRYRISLTVTDSTGLTSTQSVLIYPQKVNLSFATAPAGLTLYLDGIAKTAPFVYDTLVGFNHTVEARNQSAGGSTYTFGSWSDGGAQTHTIVVPSTTQSYLATFQTGAAPAPVAAYSFNEGSGTSAADSSGSGNNGAVGTATWTTQGKFGNALSFNGTSAEVTVGDSPSLRLTSGMTLEAWVYPTVVSSAWRDVMVKGNDNYYLMATSSQSSRPAGAATLNGTKKRAFGTSALPLNTWTHLSTTYDGTAVRLFVNGLQVASTAATGTIAASASPLQIGGDALFSQFFAGRIDEVRIYNAALSASQIQADMTTPLGSPQPDSQPPTAPSNLQATANGTQITLAWTASTDNVGVTGYRVERCLGAGCLTFVQVATPASSPFTDIGLTATTSYSYRVRAVDAAGNLSLYSNTATATTQSAPPSLVAAYSFNEGSGTSAGDSSGSGNAGATGSATWTTQGRFGNALSFNGTDAKVTVPDTPSLRLTSAMTLEAWVNPSVVSSAWRDLIIKGSDDYYVMATSTSASVPVGAGIFGGVKARAFGTSPLALNSWTHLATTYDGANLKLYVNGVLVATTPKTGTIQTSASPLQMGGDAIYGQYFSGLIDEVRVYNSALTQAQVLADMTTPV